MELAFAFLAAAADVTQDNRFHVLGGDIDAIFCDQLPATAPTVALVFKAIVLPDEASSRHTYRLEVTFPSGDRARLNEATEMRVAPNKIDPNQPSGSIVVVQMTLGFSVPGKHWLSLIVDEREVASLPLHVILR